MMSHFSLLLTSPIGDILARSLKKTVGFHSQTTCANVHFIYGQNLQNEDNLKNKDDLNFEVNKDEPKNKDNHKDEDNPKKIR